MKCRSRLLTAAAGLMATLIATPQRAHACGGVFCRTTPLHPSGGPIIFSRSQSHVPAHIQLPFQGQAKDFAWVVPVQVNPEISVGSQSIFPALQQQTQPQYQIDWKFASGYCGFRGGPVSSPGAAGGTPP